MTSLDTRMKFYEGVETKRRFLPTLPVIARLDGRSFHTFTKGLGVPYNSRFRALMTDTTQFLVAESCAKIGYTQSDEITLVFHSDSFDSQIFFDGKPFKMISILASMTTAYFNKRMSLYIHKKAYVTMPLFDCRVWTVPSREEAVNVLIWREQDATRNSIISAAQAYYSHNQLDGKNTSEMQEMLHQEDVNWNDYPSFFKRGTYVQRARVLRKFTCDEMDKLPPKHEARSDPDLEIERSEIRLLDMPPILQVENRMGVVFNGELPQEAEKCVDNG